MRDNMTNTHFSATRLRVIFIVTVLALVFQFVYIYGENLISERNKEQDSQALLVTKSQVVIDQISELTTALSMCNGDKFSCNTAQLSLFTGKLVQAIHGFHAEVSKEKQLVMSTGILDFDLIELYINKYDEIQDVGELNRQLDTVLLSSSVALNNIISNYQQKSTADSSAELYLGMLFSLGLLMLFSYYHYNSRRSLAAAVKAKLETESTFKSISNDIKNIDYSEIEQRIRNINTSQIEKNIYAKLLFNFEELEIQKSKTDLLQRLYNLLGYEVRGITNTIQGCVKLLVKDSDEDGALLAKEVITATNTLENLADNFNSLSAIEAGNNETLIDSYGLLGELFVLIDSKSKQSSQSIECYVENTLPTKFHGNQSRLFWLLLMQFSNTLSSSKYTKNVLMVNCSSAKRVDKLRIDFELYQYDDSFDSMQSLQALDWRGNKRNDIAHQELSQNLFSGVGDYQANQSSLENVNRLTVSFDINAAEYQKHNDLLATKKIIVCGESAMQIDVIAKTLEAQGADIIIAPTASSILKSMHLLNENDAVYLTDSISGINLNSFCKTLKSRLAKKRIKLFISMTGSAVLDGIYNHVDHVFYQPFIPTEFISNIVATFNQNNEVNTEQSSKFLIVEDDKIQQFILKKILNNLGFECETVDDGQKALDNVGVHQYDMIFMDCIMPGMGGMEATQLIRRYESTQGQANCTIIGATGLTSKAEHKQCIDAGMDYVISKPYKTDEIYSVIKKYTAIRKVG